MYLQRENMLLVLLGPRADTNTISDRGPPILCPFSGSAGKQTYPGARPPFAPISPFLAFQAARAQRVIF